MTPGRRSDAPEPPIEHDQGKYSSLEDKVAAYQPENVLATGSVKDMDKKRSALIKQISHNNPFLKKRTRAEGNPPCPFAVLPGYLPSLPDETEAQAEDSRPDERCSEIIAGDHGPRGTHRRGDHGGSARQQRSGGCSFLRSTLLS